jgi:3-oxoacyl-[acyl-carrier-protein] synthase-3
MTRQCRTILERNGLSPKDVDLFIPHQANLRIIEAVGERLGIAGENVFINVDRYGNTSAASIPIALAEAVAAGALCRGMKVLLTSFGGGFTFGAALLQF